MSTVLLHMPTEFLLHMHMPTVLLHTRMSTDFTSYAHANCFTLYMYANGFLLHTHNMPTDLLTFDTTLHAPKSFSHTSPQIHITLYQTSTVFTKRNLPSDVSVLLRRSETGKEGAM